MLETEKRNRRVQLFVYGRQRDTLIAKGTRKLKELQKMVARKKERQIIYKRIG